MNARCRIAVLIMLALACFSLAMEVRGVGAKAHDWYDPECCSGMDCAPVEKVEVMPTAAIASMLSAPAQASVPSIMVVTTRHGTATVPPNMKMRPSQDGRMHACIVNGRLICLYLPPSM